MASAAMIQWRCMQTEPSMANRPFYGAIRRIWQRLQKCSLVSTIAAALSDERAESRSGKRGKALRRKPGDIVPRANTKAVYFTHQ